MEMNLLVKIKTILKFSPNFIKILGILLFRWYQDFWSIFIIC